MDERILEKQYEELGISKEVYDFGKKIEDSLKERFENQLEKLHEKSKGDN